MGGPLAFREKRPLYNDCIKSPHRRWGDFFVKKILDNCYSLVYIRTRIILILISPGYPWKFIYKEDNAMRSITTLDLQYAHRFYGFKGEAQYLHGHTGVLTIEV